MIRRASVLFVMACTSAPQPVVDVAAGIYVVDRNGGDPVRLASVAGDSSAIKFGVLGTGAGTVDIAYVKDNDRDLYTFESTVLNGRVSSTPPRQRLVRSDSWSLNGPTYCQARAELALGIWHAAAVDVGVIDAGALRSMEASTVEQATATGALSLLQTAQMARR